MQTASILNGRGVETSDCAQQIAFNVLPIIGKPGMKGYSSAEWQLIRQSQRITDDPQLQLSATCVQVPVFHADSMVVHIETDRPLSDHAVIELLKKQDHIKVLGDLENTDYATPVTSSTDMDTVFVSRIRNDLQHDRGLNMWIVGDDIRKGAAFNTVQIAENLVKSHL